MPVTKALRIGSSPLTNELLPKLDSCYARVEVLEQLAVIGCEIESNGLMVQ